MTYPKSILKLVVLLFLFSNCKKDNNINSASDAKIVTTAVVVYSDGGVTLNGRVNSIPTGVSEYGFLLSADSLFTNPQKYPVSTIITTGNFKIDVPTGLQKNTKYFVAAYSFNSSTAVLSKYNVVLFNSSGSKKPIFTSILPLKADIGDTITIKGKYFTYHYWGIVFDNSYGNIILTNDTVIKCVIPASLNTSAPAIAIKDNNITDTLITQFSLNAPLITNFTSLATFRDTLIINGDHFGNETSIKTVKIGDAQATIVSSSRKQIKAIVPDNVSHSFNNLSVTAQAQSVVSLTQFQIRVPIITSVNPSFGNVNDVVTIAGKYFHPIASNNSIMNENNVAQVNGGSATQLTYNIPVGPYPRRKAKVTLKLLDYSVTYSVDIAIQDKWIIVEKVPYNNINVSGAFTINNKTYLIAPSQDSSNYQEYIWQFNSTNYSWNQISIPFSCVNAKVVGNGINAYIYTTTSTNNFYEYNPLSNTWTKKADYPVTNVRQYGTMFAIGTKVYFGLGVSTVSSETPTADDTFYEYNTATDTWRKIPDYPDQPYYGARIRPSSFVINNIAYVGCGASNSGMKAFFSYSPTTDSWSQIQDFPDARSYSTGFSYGNYGYVGGGDGFYTGSKGHDCFKYDPATNVWSQLNDYIGCNVCFWGIEYGYSFNNNGNVYFGGGNSSNGGDFLYQAVGSGL
jgi:hypothetical protein